MKANVARIRGGIPTNSRGNVAALDFCGEPTATSESTSFRTTAGYLIVMATQIRASASV